MRKVLQQQKRQHYAEKNCVLSQKPLKKRFFGVFRSTVRRFGIAPYYSDDAQTHMIASQVDAQGVATIKRQLYAEKNCVLSQKPLKKWVFCGNQVYT